MPFFWRQQAGGKSELTLCHLAEAEAERGLCGLQVQGQVLARPLESNCCSRCWVLADIAGEKVPQQFSHAKSPEDQGQGSLL